MTTITKDRLLTIKQWRETYGPGSNVVLPAEEAEELARIALASIEAEPVAWKWRLTSLFDGVQIGPWRVCLAPLSPGKGGGCKTEAIPLYTAPPVPVVPAALPENDDEDGHDIDYLEPSEVYALGRTSGWNACRAAMLHSAEPVSQAYKLNALAGNSPVTPDGWISCSERMPEKGQNVLISVNFDSSLVEPLICSARYTGSTFRRGDATIKPGNGIEQATHWMPLPEPPQEVNRG
ncbi:DUF551 domain-containing protein [Escherichia albertii]|uniref:DUF551 domain-containing protein n=1 Tax=Escherichia albertii TaxID=208962 RepID=UPI002119E070|nr:DUF551 domain-containing protein [Escherichia albertii]EKB4280861.1 DUF551 domain-containing protein [Escherichia albertii]MCQ8944884.1 DUF551 domain-containing protein [Escherichia albertii]MCQ9034459.1 DUF551 domain-containing protein [Escherichia albertii]UUL20453.1 DUF551 domain-containing protein [Escherichia albertii]